MALTQEDLEALDQLIQRRVQDAQPPAPPQLTEEEQAAKDARDLQLKAGVPDVAPDAGPEYYVHLANGDVITTHDSGATHMSVDGETVAVIGRYLKHEPTGEGE